MQADLQASGAVADLEGGLRRGGGTAQDAAVVEGEAAAVAGALDHAGADLALRERAAAVPAAVVQRADLPAAADEATIRTLVGLAGALPDAIARLDDHPRTAAVVGAVSGAVASLVAARREHLEAQGLLAPGQDREELLVIRGRRAGALAPAPA